ncbi:MAG TPA: hypothetical protein VK609_11270, partial [Mucilaginibacter sp.]|nr:hypothetical protein [Mucilaginibacter sp.]
MLYEFRISEPEFKNYKCNDEFATSVLKNPTNSGSDKFLIKIRQRIKLDILTLVPVWIYRVNLA